MEAGALVEPLAVGWHAVKCSPMKEGDAVLILGGGPIGCKYFDSGESGCEGLVRLTCCDSECYTSCQGEGCW